MQRSDFEICMMAVAECRELMQSVKADLDNYICMKREQSKEEAKIIATAVTEGINMIMSTMNHDASKSAESSIPTVDINTLGDNETGRINEHELSNSSSDIVTESGDKGIGSNTAGEKEIEGIDPDLLEDEEDDEEI